MAVGSAARGVGALVATARGAVGDRFLERGQALRLAVLDLAHVSLLCAYAARLAQAEGDGELRTALERHADVLRALEPRARRLVLDVAAEPDGAIAPLDASPVGRVAQRLTETVGALGERLDRPARRG